MSPESDEAEHAEDMAIAASMRPGRNVPGKSPWAMRDNRTWQGFNEAGAQCPRKAEVPPKSIPAICGLQ